MRALVLYGVLAGFGDREGTFRTLHDYRRRPTSSGIDMRGCPIAPKRHRKEAPAFTPSADPFFDELPEPKTTELIRSGGWVDIAPYIVRKYVRDRAAYVREREMTRLLARYPHFVALLWADDECQILGLARIEDTGNWHRLSNDQTVHVRLQIDYIFAVLRMERLVPSGELAIGFNNIALSHGNEVNMFDYGAYCTCPGSYRNCTAEINEVEDTVIHNLVYHASRKVTEPGCRHAK